MSEPFPIWSTKWCISNGIEACTAWPYPGNPAWCVCASGRLKGTILQAGQWFRTQSEAVKEANRVLKAALQSARNRVEELESIVFSEVEDVECKQAS